MSTENTNALTILSEDEQMFSDMVREFAENELRPLVQKQDQEMKLDSSLLPKLFELGLMGIEIPEEYGGAGASFFMAALQRKAVRGPGLAAGRGDRSGTGPVCMLCYHSRTPERRRTEPGRPLRGPLALI